MKQTGFRALLVGALLFIGLVGRAAAFPLLQVDIVGGHYDNALQEVVADGPSFTLYVYLNATTAAQMADTYYISAALTPHVYPPGGNFGSFSFGGATTGVSYVDTNSANATPDGTTVNVAKGTSTTVLATQDMVYGDAPLERFQNNTASFDPGDLSPHGIYNTYFREFSFKFDTSRRSMLYDTVEHAGQGPINVPVGTPLASTMFYQAFTVNTASLSTEYQVHFDLYSETLKDGDVDVNGFAPFSHTGRSDPPPQVPEPASMVLLGSGLVTLIAARRRRSQNRG